MATPTPLFSIKVNEAGREEETEEVLYTGLTIKEAYAKLRSLHMEYHTYEAADDLMNGVIPNFIVSRDN